MVEMARQATVITAVAPRSPYVMFDNEGNQQYVKYEDSHKMYATIKAACEAAVEAKYKSLVFLGFWFWCVQEPSSRGSGDVLQGDDGFPAELRVGHHWRTRRDLRMGSHAAGNAPESCDTAQITLPNMPGRV